MTDSRVTPQAAEAAAKALGVKPCRVDPKNWYSCGGDDDPTEGYSCSDWQCENQDHKGRRACDNPWHRVPAALAAAVPLLCQPLQDEIDRLRAIVDDVRALAEPKLPGNGPIPAAVILRALRGKRVYAEDLHAALAASPVGTRGVVVMEAHLAADCPDRLNCWARDIHDALGGAQVGTGGAE